MHTQSIQVESAHISLPLNEAVQRSNGAQFALLVSLLFESQRQQPVAVAPESATEAVASQTRHFNLEHSLSRALQDHRFHQFNLLRSLSAERVLSDSSVVVKANNTHIADDVLAEIEHGYRSGNTSLGQQAQKISLASTADAA